MKRFFNLMNNTKDIPEVTNFLTNNQTFRQGVFKFEANKSSIKDKIISVLDKAAFPEKYERKKIEHKNKKKWNTYI